MAVLTRIELRNKVLKHLGVLGAGESPDPNDAALVDEQIDTVIGELERFGDLEANFNADSIPEWAQNAMRDRVSFLVAPDFRVPPPRIQELAGIAGAALALLLRHTAAYFPTDRKDEAAQKILVAMGVLSPGESAPAAHLALINDAQGSTYAWLVEKGAPGWTLDTIPEWALDHWRDVVAARAAPLFRIVDPNQLNILQARHEQGLREILTRFSKLEPADTQEDLGNKVLNYLGLTSVAEKPTTAQRIIVDDGIERCIEQLTQENVIYFGPKQIPQWAFHPLRDYVAWYVSPSLGRPRDQLLTISRTEAVRELRAQSAAEHSAQPTEGRYF